MLRRSILWAPLLMLSLPLGVHGQQDLNEITEKAMRDAVNKAAPSIVRIETSGGQDMIVWTDRSTGAPIRKVVGPTTGVVVAADGYIITSSFNFINKPTDIVVTIPGKGRAVAKVVANDQSRMLTLLKVDMKDLVVPKAAPKKEMEVGMWALALGRTLNPNVEQPPSMSAGIISAIGRIWGKAVQCDAKVSPVNYGGALIDIQGRVLGILVPASPNSEGENAGVEWYDSGIGFAIPLEDINRVLPKLKTGTPEKPFVLRGGLFGFPQPQPNQYLNPPVISSVIPESAADKAGIKAGDLVISVDGKPIYTMAQFLHAFKPLYEGDSFSMVVKRGDKEVNIEKVVLQGSQASLEAGFLGILPMRDDPDPGVEIRFVYPDSPAAKAGIKAGDRIMKMGPTTAPALQPFNGRDQFMARMAALQVNMEVKLEVKRKEGKVETLTVRLAAFPDVIPDQLPEESSKKRALERPKNPVPPKKGPGPQPKDPPMKEEPKKEEPKKEPKKDEVEKGKILKRTNPTLGREYWVFVPRTYDPNVSHGLLVWLHPANRPGRDADDMKDIWEEFCEDYNIIMMGPISENKEGWVPSESDGIMSDVNAVLGQYTIDRQRVVMHGSGIGGQMCYYMGFQARDVVRGVATVGAVLATQPKDSLPNQRVQFMIVVGEKDPLVKDIKESTGKLKDKKYNVIYREMKNIGKQYVAEDREVMKQLVRWIDSLDRQ